MSNKILVTGGLGFIGTHLLIQLLETTDHHVVCLDKETYASNKINIKNYLKQNSHHAHRIKFLKKDIGNKKHVAHAFAHGKFDFVINVAAESHVDNSIKGPAPFVSTNIVGTFNLLECARIYDVKKFIQVSTDEVYGQLESVSQNAFRETTAIKPSSVYSASKASADVLALSYYKTYNLPVMITRCCNNYGPYQHEEKLIPKTIIHALSNKSIPVYGQGTNMREWIHVIDHCRAILMVLQHGCTGQVYNIGTDTVMTNMQLVQSILHAMGKDTHLIEHVADRPGHDFIYRMNSDKIRCELNWRPQVPWHDGLMQCIHWYEHQAEKDCYEKDST